MLNQFHDAEIISVERSSVGVVLSFVLANGEPRTLSAEKCKLLRVDNFGLRNIISRAYEPKDQLPIKEALIKGSLADDGETLLLSEAGLASLTSLVSDGQMRLLIFEPSYGAEIILVCEFVREE